MAALVLARCFLLLATDPTQVLAFYSSSPDDKRSRSGGVREYANGRFRAVTGPGTARKLTRTAVGLSMDQLDLMDSWEGQTVLFRDVRGRKMWGSYFDLDVADAKDRSGFDVTFTLQQITYSEAV